MLLLDIDDVTRRPLNREYWYLDRLLFDGGASPESFYKYLYRMVDNCAKESWANNGHLEVRCSGSKQNSQKDVFTDFNENEELDAERNVVVAFLMWRCKSVGNFGRRLELQDNEMVQVNTLFAVLRLFHGFLLKMCLTKYGLGCCSEYRLLLSG